MNEMELFNRLITDIESSINIRTNLPSIQELTARAGLGQDTARLFQSSLNTIQFDEILSRQIIPLINNLGELITITNPINLSDILNQFNQNRNEIINRFYRYLNDRGLILLPSGQTIGVILDRQLGLLHNVAR